MLRVLRHYLPLRKALLVFSETILLAVILAAGMTMHLVSPKPGTIQKVATLSLNMDEAMWRCLGSSVLLAVIAQLAITFNELYDFGISSSRFDRASRFIGSAGSAVALGLFSVLLTRTWRMDWVLDFPGMGLSQVVQTLVFTMLVGFGVLYLWRSVFHFILRRWHFSERVLVLGAGPTARALAIDMSERPYSGYEAVGLVPEESLTTGPSRLRLAKGDEGGERRRSTDPAEDGPPTRGLPTVGWNEPTESTALVEGSAAPRIRVEPVPVSEAAAVAQGQPEEGEESLAEPRQETLYELVQRLRVDTVVCALENRRGRLPTDELLRCRLSGVAVREQESVYEQLSGKLAVEAMRPSYLIFNDGFQRSPWGMLAKRTADLVLSLVGIALTWPLMLFTAIMVRLDSPGPILFKQERVGLDGKSFTLLKFRSMLADAEKRSGPVWASEDDPRITRWGRFMRKTRLDELPQLLNILTGDMSLVGPRPERPVFVDELAAQIPYFRQRHVIKPGLTGWAQINYPYGNTVEDSLQKLQYDLFYIKYQSLLFDVSILFNTVKTVLLRKGT